MDVLLYVHSNAADARRYLGTDVYTVFKCSFKAFPNVGEHRGVCWGADWDWGSSALSLGRLHLYFSEQEILAMKANELCSRLKLAPQPSEAPLLGASSVKHLN